MNGAGETGDSGSSDSGKVSTSTPTTTTTAESTPVSNQNDEPAPAEGPAKVVPEITTKCTVCGQLTDKMCGRCGKEFYCSKKCQKVHREAHKPDCYPAKLIKEGDSEPYLIATRTLQEGELIFEEEPLLRTPSSQVTGEYLRMGLARFPVCISCTRSLSLPPELCHTCPLCKWEVCEDCIQVQNLEHRKAECVFFKHHKIFPTSRYTTMDHYDLVAAMRCLIWKSLNPTKWTQLLNMTPEMEPPLTNEEKEKEQEFKDTLYDILTRGMGFPITESEFNHWFHVFKSRRVRPAVCVHRYNTHILPYLTTFIRHSCLPNTQTVHGMDKSMTIASCKIQKGEKLTDSTRTPHCFGFTMTRRPALEERYGIVCECSRCCDPTELGTFISAIKCPGQNGKGHKELPENVGYLLPIDSLNPNSDWECNFCELTLPVSEIMEKLSPMFQNMAEFEKQCNERRFDVFIHKKVGPEDDQLIQKMEKYIEDLRKTLHPNHYVILAMEQKILSGMSACFCTATVNRDRKSEFYSPAGRLRIAKRMEVIAKHCVDVTSKLMPGRDFFTGKMLYFHAVALLIWLIGSTTTQNEEQQQDPSNDDEFTPEIMDNNDKPHESKRKITYKLITRVHETFKDSVQIERKYRNACIKEYKMIECLNALGEMVNSRKTEFPVENTEKEEADAIEQIRKQVEQIALQKWGSEGEGAGGSRSSGTKTKKKKNNKKNNKKSRKK